MRAAYYEGRGSIRVGECVPVEPAPGQVQLRVANCGICGTDLHIYHGNMDHRVKTPQVIGHETSAIVERLGDGVQGVAPGDRVTVMPLDPCHHCPACRAGHSHICQNLRFIGIDAPGGFQARWTVPAHTLLRVPERVSLEHAALIEPIAVACHDVRMGDVRPGEFAMVLGGGPIGTLVALVARHAGARVAVSEINPFRLRLIESLGLEAVNPLETNLVDFVNARTDGAGADVVFEVSGAAPAALQMAELLRTRGRVVMVAVYAKPVPVNLHRFFWRELRLIGARVYEREDFAQAIALLDAGTVPFDKLITGVYPLDGLQQGLDEMEQGGAVMKILIDCAS